ncbi:helix-turn-helix domain-containing protein [Chitinophaga oryziterrae]|uniref:Helix-turn-helix domain-containing protein n=1 Tax=Chitinophaga oryziterrae TaxID=1031224 RepID=A0A6N8JFD6_9BACT|nr:helix-turn-helix domain-containing protein [Chitinophaga oryziterrae]
MDADVYTLYESDFYRILDFKCKCKTCITSKPEYSDSFTVSFVRKGNFGFNIFRNSFDSYTGCVLITKPGYERTVTHSHAIPDECTIFDFKKDFYEELVNQYGFIKFFHNNDEHSSFVKINAETELLHNLIIESLNSKEKNKLKTDDLVMDFVNTAFGKITDYTPNTKISEKLKQNHLFTIERAKEYIAQYFSNDISLMEIAGYCFVSPFHFSRLFKTFTAFSPHQFLLNTRLKNAEILLKNTPLSIADIAFASGFNSIEHFSAAFKNKFKCAPSKMSKIP